MAKEEDIWYAAQLTRVVLAPRQTLETFGSTVIRYHLVSEIMDQVDKVRVREGKVFAERPQLITPSHFARQLINGFGEKAREYVEQLMAHGDMARILRYGLHFRKAEGGQEILSDPLDAVAARIKEQMETQGDALTAVIVGADEMWEVSLLKFVVEFIERSAPYNLRDFRQREREEQRDVRAELEADFHAAAVNPSRVDALGKKLQQLGLFDEYEDRFYALVRPQS